MVDSRPRLQPSILSRLTDSDTEGTSWQRGYDLDAMIAAVQNDLEELLNTPRISPDIPEAYERTRNSVAGYGLPELVSRTANTPEEQDQLRHLLRETICRFEPRLRNVVAEVVANGADVPYRLRVRIQAQLGVDPAPEVTFDTILELTTGRCSVTWSE
jgi:type VI secretion system protein ImpF